MSVQSEITRVTEEVSTQSELIRQISAALEGKGTGSGSSVPTDAYIKVSDWDEFVRYFRDSPDEESAGFVLLINITFGYAAGRYLIPVNGQDAGNGYESSIITDFGGFFVNSDTAIFNENDQFDDWLYYPFDYQVFIGNPALDEGLEMNVSNPENGIFTIIFSNGEVHPDYIAEYYVKPLEATPSPDTPSVPTVEQATPEITINADGLITATAVQEAGYVEAGTKSATKQLTTQAAQTIVPGTTDQVIASGRYLIGEQMIKGDANLAAENIKSGVSIFGVNGSLKSLDLSSGFIPFMTSQPSKTLDSTVTGIPLNAICYIQCTSTGCAGILDANANGASLGSGNTCTRISDRVEGSMRFTSYKSGSWESTKGTIWYYVP